MTNHPNRGVVIHPQYGERVVRVAGRPYHWDGAVSQYRPGYGSYATTTMIGDWRPVSAADAARIRREVRS